MFATLLTCSTTGLVHVPATAVLHAVPAMHVSTLSSLAASRHPVVACKLGDKLVALKKEDMADTNSHKAAIDDIDHEISEQQIAIEQCAEEEECLLEEVCARCFLSLVTLPGVVCC